MIVKFCKALAQLSFVPERKPLNDAWCLLHLTGIPTRKSPAPLQTPSGWGIETLMKRNVVLATGLVLASCMPADPVSPGEIVFLGDSLTEGYGLDFSEAYPALLKERLAGRGLTMVNAGISGDTTSGGLGRVGTVVGSDTRVLVLALGANDVLGQGDPATMKSNLLAIIAEARAANPHIRILLAGIRFSFRVDPGTYSNVYAEVAKETGVAYLPHLLKGVISNPRLNQQDGIHPTAEGQKIMAETIMEALEPLL